MARGTWADDRSSEGGCVMIDTKLFRENYCECEDHCTCFGFLDGQIIELCDAYDAQKKEIEKLKTALQFYANGRHFQADPMGVSAFLKDFGDVAREALKGGV